MAPVATPVRNTSVPASVEALPGDDGSKDPETGMPAPTEPQEPSVDPKEKEPNATVPGMPLQELNATKRKAILCMTVVLVTNTICICYIYIRFTVLFMIKLCSDPISSDRLDLGLPPVHN